MQDKQPDLVHPKSDCVIVSLHLANDKTNPTLKRTNVVLVNTFGLHSLRTKINVGWVQPPAFNFGVQRTYTTGNPLLILVSSKLIPPVTSLI